MKNSDFNDGLNAVPLDSYELYLSSVYILFVKAENISLFTLSRSSFL